MTLHSLLYYSDSLHYTDLQLYSLFYCSPLLAAVAERPPTGSHSKSGHRPRTGENRPPSGTSNTRPVSGTNGRPVSGQSNRSAHSGRSVLSWF